MDRMSTETKKHSENKMAGMSEIKHSTDLISATSFAKKREEERS